MAFKATLVIESSELSLAQISQAMGLVADVGFERGSMSSLRRRPRERSSWSVELRLPLHAHAGTEGLAVAIESLGMPVARRVRRLVVQGCVAVVSVCQELSDSPSSLGIHLTPDALAWVAAAGASIDVDQYLALDE